MELFENEIIKDISGFEGKYGITNFGRVYSYLSNKFLKSTKNYRKNTNGEIIENQTREYVNLGRGNRFYIHQLVANAFLENSENKKEIDHIDTNPLNNNVNNLRWVTREENMHNISTLSNLKNNTGWLIEIEEIETGRLFYGYTEAAEKCGVSKATIGNHVQNKVKNPKWRATGKRINPKYC